LISGLPASRSASAMRPKFPRLISLMVGVSAVAMFADAASAESFTTRIETRPYYGAVITLEQGVRVYRPLPPVRQVIINPNRTPVEINYNDTRVYSYGSAGGYGGVVGGGGNGDGNGIYYAPVGGPFFFRRGGFHNRWAWGRVHQWRPGFHRV